MYVLIKFTSIPSFAAPPLSPATYASQLHVLYVFLNDLPFYGKILRIHHVNTKYMLHC